jgi:AraC-like DNA-binding protein
MNPIYLTGAMQALFGCIFLNSKRNKQLSDFVLTGWFFLFFLYLLTFYFTFKNGEIMVLPCILVQPLLLLAGPAIFIYIDLLSANKQRFKKIYWIHFVPFILSYILDIVYFGVVGFDKLTLDYYTSLTHTRIMFALRIISPILYSQWILARIKSHQFHIREEFSFSEKIDLNWVKYLCYGLIAANLISIAFVALENIFKVSFKYGFNYYILIIISAYVFYVSFFSFKQRVIFRHEAKNGSKPENVIANGNLPKPSVEVVTKEIPLVNAKIVNKTVIENSLKNRRNMEELKIYEKRLYTTMEQKKLFLEPELSLAQLASNLNMTSHLLSQVLNECIMMNFYDFVNSYRVIEMKSKLANRSYDKYNIVVLAYESGFNSKASFQRIFKNHTGLTPTEYKRHLLQQETVDEVKEVELYPSLV